MILAGLTGGIGSGKSVVSKLFAEQGAHIIDADEIAHQVIAPETPAHKLILERFGDEVLAPDGTIDRVRLGETVFADEEKRLELNAIVHPFVFAEEERRRKEIEKREPDAVVIFDAALLIETGAYQLMDRVILVYADTKTQISRVMARNGLSKSEAKKRIACQMPFREKKKHADYLLDGRTSIESLRAECRKILEELRGLRGSP